MIDVNVSLGRWPFQRFLFDAARPLARHLKSCGIRKALVGSTESVLYPDPDVYDESCFEQIRAVPGLLPVKTVNPVLATWRTSLCDFTDRYEVKAIRLYPNYHRYGLDDPMVNELAKTAIKLKLPIMVAVRVEDERQQYPLMQVPGVPLAAIAKFAAAHPRARVIALNGYFHEIIAVEEQRNLYFDIAFAETTNTLRALTGYMPARQLVFGSQTPFLTTKAAAMKVELANIPPAGRERIAAGNAASLFRLDR
jgi:hypothetical protein